VQTTEAHRRPAFFLIVHRVLGAAMLVAEVMTEGVCATLSSASVILAVPMMNGQSPQ
jgi:hypothetical protein